MPKKRADGEGTYVHTGDMWRFIITVAGKRKAFSATGKGGKAAAKEKYESWKKERDGVDIAVSADMHLGAWMKMYLENYRKGTVKETSYHQLELLADRLPKSLADKKICEIHPIEIQSFLNKFAVDASKSYVDKMSGLLKAAFSEAQENGLRMSNPARKLKIPQIRTDPKQSYTREEVTKICEYASTYHQDEPEGSLRRRAGLLTGAAIICLLATGLRRGELLGLMWGDIATDKLTVNRAVYTDKRGAVHVDEYRAKTVCSLRTIPLPPNAYKAMQNLPRRGMYIFSSESGGIMSPRNFNRSYDAFFKNHPDLRHLTPHECRHTCATLMLDSGVDIRIVQEILGHEDIKTTSGYTHPDYPTMSAASTVFYNAIWCNNKCNDDVKISANK